MEGISVCKMLWLSATLVCALATTRCEPHPQGLQGSHLNLSQASAQRHTRYFLLNNKAVKTEVLGALGAQICTYGPMLFPFWRAPRKPICSSNRRRDASQTCTHVQQSA